MSDEKEKKQPESPPAKKKPDFVIGKDFLSLLNSLTQSVKIHQDNNRLVVESVKRFLDRAMRLMIDDESLTIQLSGGRFFLQEEKIPFRRESENIITNMVKFFELRNIEGLRFYPSIVKASFEEILSFIRLLNTCAQKKNPLAWLLQQMDEKEYEWVVVVQEQPSGFFDSTTGKNAQPSGGSMGHDLGPGAGPGEGLSAGAGAGLGAGAALAAGNGTGAGAGTGTKLSTGPGAGPGLGAGLGSGVGAGPGLGAGKGSGPGAGPGLGTGRGTGPGAGLGGGVGPGAGPGQGAGKGSGPGAGAGIGPGPGMGPGPGDGGRGQTIGMRGRREYSYAMTSMREVAKKVSLNKRAGVRKAVRVIQDMVEMVMQDKPILLALSTIRIYDDYTFTHSVNVSILAMYLGKQLGLSRDSLERLGVCGLFHDLGKILIPQEILNKQDKLSETEFKEIQKHSLNSVRLIVRLRASRDRKARIILAPFEHHMKYNLTGYPLVEWQRPQSLFGRILAIADVYDALTSPRVYRPIGLSADRALGLMLKGSGKDFDPVLLKIFINMLGVYPIGTLLLLDTGEMGLVFEAGAPENIDRPKLLLLRRNIRGKIKKDKEIDLTERDKKSGSFKRNVFKSMHPSTFDIQPAEFLT